MSSHIHIHSYSILPKTFKSFVLNKLCMGITSPDFSLKLSWRFHHDFSLNFAMNVPLELHKRSQFNELPQGVIFQPSQEKDIFCKSQILHFGVHRLLEIPVGALKKGERNLLLEK